MPGWSAPSAGDVSARNRNGFRLVSWRRGESKASASSCERPPRPRCHICSGSALVRALRRSSSSSCSICSPSSLAAFAFSTTDVLPECCCRRRMRSAAAMATPTISAVPTTQPTTTPATCPPDNPLP
eukprot:353404-Chlamydomonas_euryale.AAC.21